MWQRRRACAPNLLQDLARATAIGLLLVAAILVNASSATAARLYIADYEATNDPDVPWFKPVCNVVLSGAILEGDFARISARLEQFDAKARDRRYQGSMHALCLSSSGGDIREAIRIGQLLRADGNWMTVVEAGNACISACAVIFMSAAPRFRQFERLSFGGTYEHRGAGRYLHYQATLGFHAPRLEVPADAGGMVSATAVAEAYKRALDTMRAIIFNNPEILDPDKKSEGDVAREQFGAGMFPDPRDRIGEPTTGTAELMDGASRLIPEDLDWAFFAVPPDKLATVDTVSQAIRWGIDLYGFDAPATITERMLVVACANLLYVRCIQGGPFRKCPRPWVDNDNFGAQFPDGNHNLAADIDKLGVEKWWSSAGAWLDFSSRRLWPAQGKSGKVAAQGFKLVRKAQRQDQRETICNGRVIHLGGRLHRIDVNTSNDLPEQRRPSSERFTADDEKIALGRSEDVKDLEKMFEEPGPMRFWQMLPAVRRLSDLSSQPWAGLASGKSLGPGR